MTTATVTTTMPTAIDNDGGNGDNEDGEVEHDGGDDDNSNDDNDVNIDVVEDDDDVGTTTMRGDEDKWTTTMRWRWAASDTENPCERRVTHPRQQSTYVDSLGRS